MAWQIIKQPDGKYAIWSSVTDSVISYDATRKEIIDEFVTAEVKRVKSSVEAILDKLDRGENPYYQFAVSWDEAKETIT